MNDGKTVLDFENLTADAGGEYLISNSNLYLTLTLQYFCYVSESKSETIEQLRESAIAGEETASSLPIIGDGKNETRRGHGDHAAQA